MDQQAEARPVPVSGLGRRFSALGGPLKGWQVALKRLGALPRIRRGAQGRGCGREGSGALLLPRAAAVSTRLRVLEEERQLERGEYRRRRAAEARGDLVVGVVVDRGHHLVRARGRTKLRLGFRVRV